MRRLATDPDRIDWFRVLADLRRAGAPLASVATAIRVPYSTIQGWRQGAEPKFADGERLLRLWAGLTGRELAQVPRARQEVAAQRAALQG